MGYFVANPNGDITACSIDPLVDGIEYNDPVIFPLVYAAPHNYKWINDELQNHPRPSVYHSWNGSEWELSQQLLTDARSEIWERIKDKRQEQQYKGVKITTAQGEYWIHSDEPSRSLHLGLVGAAILHILNAVVGITTLPTFPSNLAWKTMQKDVNGQPIFIQLDYVRALQIFAADKAMTASCFEIAEYHRVMMENSPDPLNYNYHVGWPPVYEGPL